MTQHSRPQSVYRRGADDGWWFGIYLTVLFVLSAYSLRVPLLTPATYILALAVPFVIYRRLRLSYEADRGSSTFSALWLQGIVTFFCACLILAMAVYIFLRFIYPGYMSEVVSTTLSILKESSSPDADLYSRYLNAMVKNHALPSPIAMSMSMVWTGVFSGSILSMILAGIIKAMPRVKPPSPGA